jgi:hypothetical protein
MSVLWVPSVDGFEGQRQSIFSMANVEFHHRMPKSIVSSTDGTEDQTIYTDSMKMDSHIPNPVCYLQRTEALSLFPYTRFNQWKFAYFLSRADFTPRLTLSSTLYLPPYSSLPLTFSEFRGSIVS